VAETGGAVQAPLLGGGSAAEKKGRRSQIHMRKGSPRHTSATFILGRHILVGPKSSLFRPKINAVSYCSYVTGARTGHGRRPVRPLENPTRPDREISRRPAGRSRR
jgi:hypothetical protein